MKNSIKLIKDSKKSCSAENFDDNDNDNSNNWNALVSFYVDLLKFSS